MVYSLDLNLTPGGVPQIVKLSQYDNAIPEIQVTLWDGNQGYTIPTGAVCYIVGTKPDKTGFEYSCTWSGSVVTVEITEQMTAVAGRVPCEIVVIKDGRKGSANFFLDVEPCALRSDVTPSETDIPIIEQLPEILAEVEAAKALAEAWAVGSGSGSDEPSDTNNAYYWALQAASYAGGGLKPEVVAQLPTQNISTSTLYFVPSASPTTSNYYDEYINIDGTSQGWEKIGTTAVDMSNYYTKSETDTLLNAKQNSTDNNLNTTNKTVVGAINELKSGMVSADIVADEYDNTATYSKGEYVMYNGSLYICTTAVSTAEDFDPTKWDERQVGTELSSINANLPDFQTLNLTVTTDSNGYAAINSDIPSGYTPISAKAKNVTSYVWCDIAFNSIAGTGYAVHIASSAGHYAGSNIQVDVLCFKE